MRKPDSYTCHKCNTRHATENLVAYCAICYDEIRKQKGELFLTGQIAKLRARVAELSGDRDKVTENREPKTSAVKMAAALHQVSPATIYRQK